MRCPKNKEVRLCILKRVCSIIEESQSMIIYLYRLTRINADNQTK